MNLVCKILWTIQNSKNSLLKPVEHWNKKPTPYIYLTSKNVYLITDQVIWSSTEVHLLTIPNFIFLSLTPLWNFKGSNSRHYIYPYYNYPQTTHSNPSAISANRSIFITGLGYIILCETFGATVNMARGGRGTVGMRCCWRGPSLATGDFPIGHNNGDIAVAR